MKGETGLIVTLGACGWAPEGCAPALVVKAAQAASSAMALAAKQASEGALEFFTRAGVDDRVNAAVKVTQPEDDFKHHI